MNTAYNKIIMTSHIELHRPFEVANTLSFFFLKQRAYTLYSNQPRQQQQQPHY
ncbi:hypothetical protein PP707_02740 [Acetobacter pasteurianus]|nr:hypothetical protein [Acetobacter pasteurianus]